MEKGLQYYFKKIEFFPWSLDIGLWTLLLSRRILRIHELGVGKICPYDSSSGHVGP
jgi:hypothetical protein